MKSSPTSTFWPSFADLMTSLFFIMLVLYLLTYLLLRQKERRLNEQVKVQEQQLRIIKTVESNLKPLREDSALFRYEEDHKRFVLAFDVAFRVGQVKIDENSLINFPSTAYKIDEAGYKLKDVVDTLAARKARDSSLRDISYILIISGYASQLIHGSEEDEYMRSYNRAWNLWHYWKLNGIDFESPVYNELIDVQIAGNGWGGVGRFQRDPENGFQSEKQNQRFIIQLVPKIGNITH